MRFSLPITIAVILVFIGSPMAASAGPFMPPGDVALRHDLQLLGDVGALPAPLTTWPVAWGDIAARLDAIDLVNLDERAHLAYWRLRSRARRATDKTASFRLSAAVSENPQEIRSFNRTPRENAGLSFAVEGTGDRFAANISATIVANPDDGKDVRPDETYVAVALGNWMLSAGWMERWWGPGRNGSLILSTNARPFPGVAIQRNSSEPLESKWLRWAGSWSMTAFMGALDDERTVNGARLFGMRVTFKPHSDLEIGLSRTAQWCGDGRPCNLSSFADVLVGNDNRGVNVGSEEEPGNQLAGFDVRWSLPNNAPVALYVQWIGEDTRRGGPEIGSWLRQAGIEYWGEVRGLAHRTHVEISDSACREGGLGFSDAKADCAYEHSIYQSGYRYRRRPLGHGMDGDGLGYSLGSTLVQSAGHSWNLTLRYMDINRIGNPSSRHSLSATPRKIVDVQLAHDRLTRIGRFQFGMGLRTADDIASSASSTDAMGYIQWTTE